MPTIPVPCTNCLRFHYGICREAPKQCFRCGVVNHIERYCPYDRRVPIMQRGPLPGTARWCELNGLNNDLELKRKVLNALKTSPGCSIWVNERCIHAGNEHHFTQDESFERGRGRCLANRFTWNRSESPPRERSMKRSRSPTRSPPRERFMERSRSRIQRHVYQPNPYVRPILPFATDQSRPWPNIRSCNEYVNYRDGRPPSPRQNARYRSRTPIRRHSPSPYQCSPQQQQPWRIYASGRNATGVERRGSMKITSVHASNLMHPLPPKPGQLPIASEQALQGEISANVPRSTVPERWIPTVQQAPSIANTAAWRSSIPDQSEPHVGDPYFVLGVTEAATENEYFINSVN